MRLAALLILLAGCPAGDDEYRVVPGGGGGDHPMNPMVDATVADGAPGDGATLTGRVCVITDLRRPTTGCAMTGADGITVQLGASSATTAVDGTFSIVSPAGTGLAWHVSGTNLVTSVIPLSTSSILPVVADQTYLDLQNNNSVIVNSGEGSVFLYLVRMGMPLEGATITASPVASFPALGDRTNAANWVQGATGALGVSWTPGLLAGPVRLSVTPAGAVVPTLVDVSVEDGAITYATLVIP